MRGLPDQTKQSPFSRSSSVLVQLAPAHSAKSEMPSSSSPPPSLSPHPLPPQAASPARQPPQRSSPSPPSWLGAALGSRWYADRGSAQRYHIGLEDTLSSAPSAAGWRFRTQIRPSPSRTKNTVSRGLLLGRLCIGLEETRVVSVGVTRG